MTDKPKHDVEETRLHAGLTADTPTYGGVSDTINPTSMRSITLDQIESLPDRESRERAKAMYEAMQDHPDETAERLQKMEAYGIFGSPSDPKVIKLVEEIDGKTEE